LWLEKLYDAAVISATHEARHEFQQLGCPEGTQLDNLRRLLDWLLGNFESKAAFFWLYGDPGVGKSSIAQTFAVQCARDRRLLASFFFSRNHTLRSSHTSLMATIIHQAVTAVPELKPLVADAMEKYPSILKKRLKDPIIHLLVEPIDDLITSGFDKSSIPNLIIIDGLDECYGASNQRSILKEFTEALPLCRHRLRILITSRHEVEIKMMFNSEPLRRRSTRMALASFKPGVDSREVFIRTCVIIGLAMAIVKLGVGRVMLWMMAMSGSVILGGLVLITVGWLVFMLILLVVCFILGKDVADAWAQHVNAKLEALWFYNFLVEFSKAFNNVHYRR